MINKKDQNLEINNPATLEFVTQYNTMLYLKLSTSAQQQREGRTPLGPAWKASSYITHITDHNG